MSNPDAQAYSEWDHEAASPDPSLNGAFEVQLEVFSGPLDLLLKLIERKQLDISKVALAEVAESFLIYLDAHPDMPPGPLASFVWVASKLLWIKSQSLLPRPPVPSAEDAEDDPGNELVRRLEVYKRIQDAARWLRNRDVEGLRSYERPVPLLAPTRSRHRPEPEGTGLDGVTLAKLVRMVQKRMQLALPATPEGTITQGHEITVDEKVVELREQIRKLKKGERLPISGELLKAAARSRSELAAFFLALLEIIRRKYGTVEQDELFGEIWLKRNVKREGC